jgi:hypothetical protein
MGLRIIQNLFIFGLNKLKNYEAYSVITENAKEKKIKVTQTTENNYRKAVCFFNDVKERVLTFPSLTAGSKKYSVIKQNLWIHISCINSFW